ncbi:uncharacterized protein LOC117193383 isoform X4 [Drosophila miranda]|uniref:uncharacterized protein LOC117193383 isoform X4 n=1 Tax=Drosophila miranda TaxID=7229 RepID=UPI00143F2015|nr:uncharacterized protein LOC117193383 isoform X4 [Drosophila miranda]
MPGAGARAGAPPPAPLGTTPVGPASDARPGRVPAIAKDLSPMAQVWRRVVWLRLESARPWVPVQVADRSPSS